MIIIAHQGAPIVNDATLKLRHEDVACIDIDLQSKYCEIIGSTNAIDGECKIYIGSSEHSFNLNVSYNRNEPTAIYFQDFTGWKIFATNSFRYTISVVLIPEQAQK